VCFEENLIRDLGDMKQNVQHRKELVIDARPRCRFYGEAPEPRPGLFSGHIPGSINIPFTDLLEGGFGGEMKEKQVLHEVLTEKLNEADPKKGEEIMQNSSKLVFSCGSGLTACIVALSFHVCGKPFSSLALYDGSWSEYGKETLNLPYCTRAELKKN
jgi:thiosulfate/3-mercaptopyruvate sulfurtransferase